MGNSQSSPEQGTSSTLSKGAKSDKSARNADKSPILHLPTETLIDIFQYVVEVDTAAEPTTSLRPSEIISRICRRSRQIILGLPEAWTIVDFPLYWPPERLVDYSSTMVSRAQDKPLRLVVRDGNCGGWSVAIIEAFRAVFRDSRVRSLTFYLNNPKTQNVPHKLINVLSAPPRYLTFHQAPDQRVPSKYAKLQREFPFTESIKHCFMNEQSKLSKVESIHMIDLSIHWDTRRPLPPLPFRTIVFRHSGTARRLPRPVAQAEVVFKSCPNLERLVLDGYITSNTILSPLTTPPPPLRELYLHSFDDFDHFQALYPNNARLPHLVKFGTALFHVEQLCQFLRDHPTITDLTFSHLYGRLAPGEMTELSRACSQVVRLSLPAWWAEELASPASANDPSNQQTDGRSRYMFPSVRYLRIEDAMNTMTRETFERLVEVRVVRKEPRESHPRRISAITVENARFSVTEASKLSSRKKLYPWTQSRFFWLADVRWEDGRCHLLWPTNFSGFV
ncbi:hypothetical protein PIIN_05839 [Serendipita indica DSM 11827]|uniref:F-box domain-containing protein n=1 Tax=Serendipita indica (strain DSM 11827) TaxID=1109443 RepID=G4TKR1_SERID|nr:hypothetical protein PIIN_05839 [Serendipita indica DSM 11827]